MGVSHELLVTMPNIETLWITDVNLSKGFLQPNPDGPHHNTKLFPSLRRLHLENVYPDDVDWDHLKTYLVHQTSGNQAISLRVSGSSPSMRPEVVNEINGLVEEFAYDAKPRVKSWGSWF